MYMIHFITEKYKNFDPTLSAPLYVNGKNLKCLPHGCVKNFIVMQYAKADTLSSK